jgi:hypothetical protein
VTVDLWLGLAPVLLEGAVDAFCGRPREANPYDPVSAADAWHAWLWGHDESSEQLALRGQPEAARWLGRAA